MELYDTKSVKVTLEMKKEELLGTGNERHLLTRRYLMFLKRAKNILDIQNTKCLNFQWDNNLAQVFTICLTEKNPMKCKYYKETEEIEVLGLGGNNEI